jgi:hypothetical protein
MKTDSYKKLVEENQKRQIVHWRIKGNNQMFEVNGYWYDQQFFNQMFPQWEYCKYLTKGENPDKKAI